MKNVVLTFWQAVIDDRSLMAGIEALSFGYLGDFVVDGHAGPVEVEVHPFFARFLKDGGR